MDIYSDIEGKIEQLGIKVNLPIGLFISQVSNTYHKYESRYYDKSQESILDSIPYWIKAFSFIHSNLERNKSIKVLDFGCGTGFATLQLINSELISKCSEIFCFDLSVDMLGKCKKNIEATSNNSKVVFISEPNEIYSILNHNKFDLIMTNSLLHHIPDPSQLVELFVNSLSSKGYYICGHEPNKSFYFNEALIKQTRSFQLFKWIYKRLEFKYIVQKTGFKKRFNIIKATNSNLIDDRIINRPIPADYLIKLIDIHVPIGLSKNQYWGELGFSRELFFKDDKNIRISIPLYYTYSHIKDAFANKFKYWQNVKKKLSKQYPNDGADFLAVVKIE